MHEAVLAGKDLDEGAEVEDAGDGTGVGLADADLLGKALDHADGDIGGVALDGGDEDGAVFLDVDVGAAGVLLDLADDAPAGADDRADLLLVDLDDVDLGRVLGDGLARLLDDLGHALEEEDAGVAGLLERALEQLAGDAADLDVHLEGGDALGGAGDLEVHVAHEVFLAGDVGEDGVLAVVAHDQAHGDAGDGGGEGHARVHEGEGAAADAGHGGRAIGGEHLADEAEGVGELRLGRDDGQQGALGEGAVPDLAAAGAAHGARLADGVGREVVVVHIALRLVRGERVELLRHVHAAEGGDGEHLRLAALEEAGAVRAREGADVDVERADLRGLAVVRAAAVAEDAVAHGLLDDGVERVADVAGLEAALELRGELGADALVLLAALAGGVRHDLVEAVGEGVVDGLDGLFVVDGGGVVLLDGGGVGGDLLDEAVDGGVRLHGDLHCLDDGLLGNLGGARLDHHDGVLRAGDDQVEVALGGLGEGRVDDVLAINAADADAADGSVEGDIADAEGGAGADGDEGVGLVLAVGGEGGGDDLDLVAEALGEEGADGTVGEAHGEDAVAGGAALAAGEAAGDLADGVEALFVVDGEGEEVDALAGVGHAGRDEDDGIALAHGDGAVGEAGEGAVLDEQGLAADLDFVGTDAGFGCCHVFLHTFSCGKGPRGQAGSGGLSGRLPPSAGQAGGKREG